MSIPEKMKALVIYPSTGAKFEERPVPQLEENDILVKVAYYAQNPTDWKHAEFVGAPNSIVGCDYSGTVVKLGPGVVNHNIKVGDHVASCVHGGKFPDKGACATYARVQSDLCFKIPEGTHLREASHFGVPFATAAQILYLHQNIPMPPEKIRRPDWYLVYGGSTSVGLFMIQLAKLAGFKVVTAASPKNFDLVKSYGADEVVDYKDPAECSKTIKAVTEGSLHLALDCISEGESFTICLNAFGSSASNKKLNTLLSPPDDVKKTAQEISVELETTLAYTLLGIGFQFLPSMKLPAIPEEREFYVKLNAKTPELIEKYGVRPNPTQEFGGFDDILSGFQYMKEGKVSGAKLVYKME